MSSINYLEVLFVTKESKIKLMTCKLQSYKNGYWRARSKRDDAAAEKWKDGCHAIKEKIDELTQD